MCSRLHVLVERKLVNKVCRARITDELNCVESSAVCGQSRRRVMPRTANVTDDVVGRLNMLPKCILVDIVLTACLTGELGRMGCGAVRSQSRVGGVGCAADVAGYVGTRAGGELSSGTQFKPSGAASKAGPGAGASWLAEAEVPKASEVPESTEAGQATEAEARHVTKVGVWRQCLRRRRWPHSGMARDPRGAGRYRSMNRRTKVVIQRPLMHKLALALFATESVGGLWLVNGLVAGTGVMLV